MQKPVTKDGQPSCSTIVRAYLLRNFTQDIPIANILAHMQTIRPTPPTTVHAAITFLIRDMADDGWTIARIRQGRFCSLRMKRAAPEWLAGPAPYKSSDPVRARFYGNLQPRYGR